MKQQRLKVTEDDLGKRADVLVAEHLPILSRSYIKRLAKEGKLIFETKPIASGFKFKRSGNLVVDYDLTKLEEIPEIDLKILYEDDHLLVIDKPSGVITHSRGKYWDEPSVASSIRRKFVNAGIKDMRAGIVHRLDRATSGVIVCAKNSEAAANLQQQFEKRTVAKTYIAIVCSNELPDQGVIEKPIGRNPKKPSQFKVDVNGKPARTTFKVIKRTDSLMLLELYPETGRTHQLRVHLASVGAPILGDIFYEAPITSSRLMLHAYKLAITHPITNERLTFMSPVPTLFEEVMG